VKRQTLRTCARRNKGNKLPGFLRTMCRFQQGKRRLVRSKKNEQCGYVIENKGPLWKTGGKTGMSMKIKVVIGQKPECS